MQTFHSPNTTKNPQTRVPFGEITIHHRPVKGVFPLVFITTPRSFPARKSHPSSSRGADRRREGKGTITLPPDRHSSSSLLPLWRRGVELFLLLERGSCASRGDISSLDGGGSAPNSGGVKKSPRGAIKWHIKIRNNHRHFGARSFHWLSLLGTSELLRITTARLRKHSRKTNFTHDLRQLLCWDKLFGGKCFWKWGISLVWWWVRKMLWKCLF